ncbi:hypothetical protein [Ciceribacter thiooxidans]|uniref:Ribbon-helix-helix CopG family protein n=1 Tax=Ciceribacter thiooxidans TaxID=1969821 RepID=A0ABV7I3P9_9HYPH|nr:hypothetical protein [Ciceribacter thiooxidans]
MATLTIHIDEATEARLRQIAEERGFSELQALAEFAVAVAAREYFDTPSRIDRDPVRQETPNVPAH